MKIETVEVLPADGALYVRITTDDGTSGVGESTYFGWPAAAGVIAESYAPMLRGADPFDTELLWLTMYRSLMFRGMALVGAISAIDTALWDIKGKALGEPVWRLLGGRMRKGVRAMRVLPYGTADEVNAAAIEAVGEGYTAVKVLLFQSEHHAMPLARRLQDLVDRTASLREALGPDIDIAVELHRNMGAADSLMLMDRIAQFSPIFVEDPLPPDSVLSLGEIARKARVPIAAGERNTTIWEFREYIEHGGIEVVRPDVGIAGGITQVKKICALAESHHLLIAPHAVPSGPVATAAHVHLGISCPIWEWQEHLAQANDPRCVDVVDALVSLKDGWLVPADAPGLGLTLNDEGIARHPPTMPTIGVALRDSGAVGYR
jgi:galactonate dehydratase